MSLPDTAGPAAAPSVSSPHRSPSNRYAHMTPQTYYKQYAHDAPMDREGYWKERIQHEAASPNRAIISKPNFLAHPTSLQEGYIPRPAHFRTPPPAQPQGNGTAERQRSQQQQQQYPNIIPHEQYERMRQEQVRQEIALQNQQLEEYKRANGIPSGNHPNASRNEVYQRAFSSPYKNANQTYQDASAHLQQSQQQAGVRQLKPSPSTTDTRYRGQLQPLANAPTTVTPSKTMNRVASEPAIVAAGYRADKDIYKGSVSDVFKDPPAIAPATRLLPTLTPSKDLNKEHSVMFGPHSTSVQQRDRYPTHAGGFPSKFFDPQSRAFMHPAADAGFAPAVGTFASKMNSSENIWANFENNPQEKGEVDAAAQQAEGDSSLQQALDDAADDGQPDDEAQEETNEKAEEDGALAAENENGVANGDDTANAESTDEEKYRQYLRDQQKFLQFQAHQRAQAAAAGAAQQQLQAQQQQQQQLGANQYPPVQNYPSNYQSPSHLPPASSQNPSYQAVPYALLPPHEHHPYSTTNSLYSPNSQVPIGFSPPRNGPVVASKIIEQRQKSVGPHLQRHAHLAPAAGAPSPIKQQGLPVTKPNMHTENFLHHPGQEAEEAWFASLHATHYDPKVPNYTGPREPILDRFYAETEHKTRFKHPALAAQGKLQAPQLEYMERNDIGLAHKLRQEGHGTAQPNKYFPHAEHMAGNALVSMHPPTKVAQLRYQ